MSLALPYLKEHIFRKKNDKSEFILLKGLENLVTLEMQSSQNKTNNFCFSKRLIKMRHLYGPFNFSLGCFLQISDQ